MADAPDRGLNAALPDERLQRCECPPPAFANALANPVVFQLKIEKERFNKAAENTSGNTKFIAEYVEN